MAEMVGSAFVQEAVSRAVSFVLGKREEAASQGHLMKRLEMAANELERALERSAKLVITDVSLLQRRNRLIKPAYIEAMELLEMHRQQQSVLPAAGGQQDHQLVSRGQKKRKLWMVFRANTQDVVPVEAPSSAGGGLDMAVVQRLEQSADWGRELVRDVESACSLWSNNLCSNPVARHLFQGRNLSCRLVQGNQRRVVRIWPLRSEERGVEVVLGYSYDDEHDSTPMRGKTFDLMLILRLSESVDIVGVAIKGLEYLASQFKLPTESAVGELTLLPTLLQGLAPSPVPWEVDFPGLLHSLFARFYRRDPACCGASRLGLCSSNNNVSSELSHVFPEEVICFLFRCYISAAVEPPNSSRSRGSSIFGAGRNISSSSMAVLVHFAPHKGPSALQSGSLAVVEAGGVETERRDESLQQVSQTLKSDAINCFLRSYDDEHDSTPMGGKTFILILILRPSESVDIVGVAIKGLEYLASQFMLGTESAVGELTLLPTLLQGLAPSPVPWEVDPIGWIHSWCARLYRPDPACCGASRLGLCSRNNNVSSELSHVFPEEVICFLFRCYGCV